MVTEPTTALGRRSGSSAEALASLRRRVAAFPGRYVDMSTASPVDPAPEFIEGVAAAAHDAHAYPPVEGTPAMRSAIADWFAAVRGVRGIEPAQVLPTSGSKELIGLLPFHLGLGVGDLVVVPELAYPSYGTGAIEVGAGVVAEDDPAKWPERTRLVWLNSPRNPDGRIIGVPELRAAVARARALDAVIVGDECYALTNEVGGRRIPSILDAEVTGGDPRGVLASYSVSKQSNLAGHRAGLVAGDPELVGRIADARRRVGLIVPQPEQEVLVAALGEPAHVVAQRERYAARLGRLRAALGDAGFRVDSPAAGIYAWATRGEDGRATAEVLAEAGILVTLGESFGSAGVEHVRFAVTVSDADLGLAIERLARL